MSFTGQNPRFRSTILTDVGLASIGNPASGSHRIINRGGTLQVQDSTGLETAIGAGGTVDRITQTAHGFAVGEILYYTGSAYARALANAANTSEIVGMVSRVIDANTFEVTLEGKVTGLTGLTAGEAYFLSPTVSGAITATEPSVLGHVSLPIGVAISTSAFYVKSSRGAIVGGTNARTEISLFNNASTNTQLVTAYDAGEMTGWVVITGTTSYRFYVAIQFSKNAAGSDYNVSYQTSGETPPAGFSIQYSANYITVTLPSIAGFSSAKLNYALNAPAVGATFPLAVDGANVTAASATAQGTVTTGAQTFAGAKTFQDAPVIGNASGIAAASGSAPGVVTTTAQTFAGVKTFQNAPVIGNASGIAAASGSAPGVVTTTAQTFAGQKLFANLQLIGPNWTSTASGSGTILLPINYNTEGKAYLVLLYYSTTTTNEWISLLVASYVGINTSIGILGKSGVQTVSGANSSGSTLLTISGISGQPIGSTLGGMMVGATNNP